MIHNAIKIIGAKNNWEGVETEYKLVEKMNCKVLEQMLIHEDDHSYDCLTLQDTDGKVTELWFDITDFFGKW